MFRARPSPAANSDAGPSSQPSEVHAAMAGHMPETSMETSPTPVQATAAGAGGGEGPFWQKMIADK